jgi:hypothetical protein
MHHKRRRGSGMGTKIKYLQRTPSGAAGNGRAQRSSTYLRHTTSAAANNGQGPHYQKLGTISNKPPLMQRLLK